MRKTSHGLLNNTDTRRKMIMKKINGGVTAAKGFQAASTAAGIKYKDRKGN